MPLSRFRQAQAGFTVTLGDRLPQIEASAVATSRLLLWERGPNRSGNNSAA